MLYWHCAESVEGTDGETDEEEAGDTNIDPDRKKSERAGAKKEPQKAEVDEDGYLKFRPLHTAADAENLLKHLT